MSRRLAASGKDHFDLLPFIAILMCVLGCLLLVTMSISALSIGPEASEGWIPEGSDRPSAKIPILVEWDGKAVIVHRDGIKQELSWLPSASLLPPDENGIRIPSDSPRAAFDAFIAEMTLLKETHYALIAVRPSGFADFNKLAYEFRRKNITLGFEPIEQSKPVRLLPTRDKT